MVAMSPAITAASAIIASIWVRVSAVTPAMARACASVMSLARLVRSSAIVGKVFSFLVRGLRRDTIRGRRTAHRSAVSLSRLGGLAGRRDGAAILERLEKRGEVQLKLEGFQLRIGNRLAALVARALLVGAILIGAVVAMAVGAIRAIALTYRGGVAQVHEVQAW